LAIYRQIGDADGEATAFDGIADCDRLQGKAPVIGRRLSGGPPVVQGPRNA